MAGYYPYIVILLPIYSHLTHAFYTDYEGRPKIVKEHLRAEKPLPIKKMFGRSSSGSSKERSDMVCDLDEYNKRLLCDELMYNLIYKKHGLVFKSYAKSSDLPVPDIADTEGRYKCADIPIKELSMTKPMYWCRTRRYNKRESTDRGIEDGFFCAGSLNDDRRVYLFRPSDLNALKVQVLAEVNGYTPDTDAPPSSSPESQSDDKQG